MIMENLFDSAAPGSRPASQLAHGPYVPLASRAPACAGCASARKHLDPPRGDACPPARRYGERSWLRSVATALTFAPMTGIWNLAGFPAASVPVPGRGLPGAVQLVAAPGGEQALLALAAQLERASPWRRHAPAYDPAG